MQKQVERQLLATWISGENIEDLRYFEARDFKDGNNAELFRMLKDGRTNLDIIAEHRADYLELLGEIRTASLYEEAIRRATNELPLRYALDGASPEEISEKTEALDARLKGSKPTAEEKAKQTVQLMRNRIEEAIAPTIVSTGFRHLDEQIDGGLRAGLYVIGAISSLGKTSFCVQVADQIAKAGKPVLFVSLEMAREELVAKIVSRLTYEISHANGNRNRDAKTTIKVLNTHEHKHYTETEQATIKKALDELEARGDKLVIMEGMGDVTVKRIKAKAKQVEKLYRAAPVVIVDYMQILAPEASYKGLTDKQATDKNVLELKRLSRDLDTPVIAISSFNRDNYNEPVSLASFKESGAIEYTADVLLGLQLAGMDYDKSEKPTERAGRINRLRESADLNGKRGKAQDLELKILKNRNGSRGSLRLEFVPMFNSFKDVGNGKHDTYEGYTLDDNIGTI